jgi:hypothetical protein
LAFSPNKKVSFHIGQLAIKIQFFRQITETEHFTDQAVTLQAKNKYFKEKAVDLPANTSYIM